MPEMIEMPFCCKSVALSPQTSGVCRSGSSPSWTRRMLVASSFAARSCGFAACSDQLQTPKRSVSDLGFTSRSFSLRRELIFFVFEQQIERSERTVRAGNVLLHFDLFAVIQTRMAIDFLLQNPQLIAEADDFVKEHLDRHLLRLQ